MNETLQSAVARIGQQATWTGGQVAARVQVVDVKAAYGHLRYLVRDCLDRETWIQSENLRFEQAEN